MDPVQEGSPLGNDSVSHNNTVDWNSCQVVQLVRSIRLRNRSFLPIRTYYTPKNKRKEEGEEKKKGGGELCPRE